MTKAQRDKVVQESSRSLIATAALAAITDKIPVACVALGMAGGFLMGVTGVLTEMDKAIKAKGAE